MSQIRTSLEKVVGEGDIAAWAPVLEDGKAEEGRRCGVKRRDLYLFILAVNIKRPPQDLKLACSQGSCEWHSWITQTGIDENPAIRGHDLCFDKMCQWRLCLETRSKRPKNGSK